jgi:hypothetical protein
MLLLWRRNSLKRYTLVKKHRFNHVIATKQTKQTAWPESASELVPTERLPLLANLVPTFSDRGCHLVSVTDPYCRILGFLNRSRQFFLSSSSSVVLTRLSGPRSRPTTSQKIWQRRESNPDLWICSQELWPVDHRGGHAIGYLLTIFLRCFLFIVNKQMTVSNSILLREWNYDFPIHFQAKQFFLQPPWIYFWVHMCSLRGTGQTFKY